MVELESGLMYKVIKEGSVKAPSPLLILRAFVIMKGSLSTA